jgi:putative DNA primase/helicase
MIIPTELLSYRQFILWRSEEVHGRMTKVPISPVNGMKASCNDPRTWGWYRQAGPKIRQYNCDGLGFVFTAQDPFCGIDLDDCFVDGKLKPWAEKIVSGLNSFTEYSPSGKGLHVIVKAQVPTGCHPKGLGIFSESRYFTMSGRHYSGTPTSIEDRQEQIDRLYAAMTVKAPAQTISREKQQLSDEEVLRRARIGSSKFEPLWAGQWQGSYPSQSEADLALSRIIAHYCPTEEQVDRLFRQSGLHREKWVRHEKYRTNTLAMAMGAGCR